MRSDPSGRWAGLDYSALVRRVVELVVGEMELEVGHMEILGIQVNKYRVCKITAFDL